DGLQTHARPQTRETSPRPARSLPKLCTSPPGAPRARRTPTAQLPQARRLDQVRRLWFAEYQPADRSQLDQDAHPKICATQPTFRRSQVVQPPESADMASPNRKRNVRRTIPSQNPVPAALQKAVLPPAEFLFVAALQSQ